MSTATALDRILDAKAERLREAERAVPLERVKQLARASAPARDFRGAIGRGCAVCDGPAIIAEIKRSSPSAGHIREGLDPATVARAYSETGAAAISVLTEEDHFSGSLGDIGEVRQAVVLPVLRKDFITDPYQVYESRAAGADAVLLIARILDRDRLAELLSLVGECGMEALVEVHDEGDLARAVEAGAHVIGVNSRDLATLRVDLGVAEGLLPLVPLGTAKVAESGVRDRAGLERMRTAGADAVLVGEALLKADDPAAALAALTGHAPPPGAEGRVIG